MQSSYDYFNSFVVKSFPRAVKAVESISNSTHLFLILDDGTCIVFNMSTMKVTCEKKFAEFTCATHCCRFNIESSATGETKELIMSQHKQGFSVVFLVSVNEIIMLNRVDFPDFMGFMRLLPNESMLKFDGESNRFITSRTTQDQCYIYVPNRGEYSIQQISLLDSSVMATYEFYEQENFIDGISCLRKFRVDSSDGKSQQQPVNYMVLAFEGLFLSILELKEEQQTAKQLLKKTRVIQSQEELPFIFDIDVQVRYVQSAVSDSRSLELCITVASSIAEIHRFVFDVSKGSITSSQSISIKYTGSAVGVTSILVDEHYLFATTVDRQLKIVNTKKAKEICTFALHSSAINGIVKIAEKIISSSNSSIEGENASDIDCLVSYGEDCKLNIIDLKKIRNRSKNNSRTTQNSSNK